MDNIEALQIQPIHKVTSVKGHTIMRAKLRAGCERHRAHASFDVSNRSRVPAHMAAHGWARFHDTPSLRWLASASNKPKLFGHQALANRLPHYTNEPNTSSHSIRGTIYLYRLWTRFGQSKRTQMTGSNAFLRLTSLVIVLVSKLTE